jgi:hypothetical protein
MTQKQFSVISMILFPLVMSLFAALFTIFLINGNQIVMAVFMAFYGLVMFLVSLTGLQTKLLIRKRTKEDELHNR